MEEEDTTPDWVFQWIDGAFKELRTLHVMDPEEERATVLRINDTFNDLGREQKSTAFKYLLGKIVRDE